MMAAATHWYCNSECWMDQRGAVERGSVLLDTGRCMMLRGSSGGGTGTVQAIEDDDVASPHRHAHWMCASHRNLPVAATTAQLHRCRAAGRRCTAVRRHLATLATAAPAALSSVGLAQSATQSSSRDGVAAAECCGSWLRPLLRWPRCHPSESIKLLMAQRVRPEHLLHAATKKVAAMQRQLAELSRANRAARLEHSLLASMCEYMAQQLPDVQQAQQLPDVQQAQQLQQLLDELAAFDATVAHATGGDNGADADDADTLAPPSDPLLLLRQVAALPPHPDAATMTLDQLQAAYASCVKDMALLLALLAHPPSSRHAPVHPREMLHGVMLRHLGLLATLVSAGRGALVQAFTMSNCLSGKVVAELDLSDYGNALESLALSQRQRQRLAAGFAVCCRLQARLRCERQRLQVAAAACDGSAEERYGRPALPLGLCQPGTADAQGQQQAALLARLDVLLRKEFCTGMHVCAILLGCMTLEQACAFAVRMYPFPALALALAAAAAEQLAAAQARQPGDATADSHAKQWGRSRRHR